MIPNRASEMIDADFESLAGIKTFLEMLGHNKFETTKSLNRAIDEGIAGKLKEVQNGKDYFSAKYVGSMGAMYEISIQLQYIGAGGKPDWADIVCSCPQACKNKICKHGIAGLLWRLPDDERPAAQLRTANPNSHHFDNNVIINASEAPASRRILPGSYTKSEEAPPPRKSRGNEIQKASQKLLRQRKPQVPRPAKPNLPATHLGGEPGKRWLTGEEMMQADDADLLQECYQVLSKRRKEYDDIAEEKSKSQVFKSPDLLFIEKDLLDGNNGNDTVRRDMEKPLVHPPPPESTDLGDGGFSFVALFHEMAENDS